ncbi:hypothetical protein V8E54_009886 [Elaphomyces granulatus]
MVPEMEATQYYAGLPSSPRLLARTSSTLWQKSEGPEAYRKIKQLGVVVNHKLNSVWEFEVAPKAQACLDKMQVLWTSLDIVRIGEVGVPSTITLWIGVKPKSLDGEHANIAAFRCLDVLKVFGITDVDVEIRESLVIRSAGPQLLPPVLSSNPTAEVRHPLTHALGLHITPLDAPFSNDKFDRNTNKPRSNVLLLGDKAYTSLLTSIRDKIGQHGIVVEDGKRRIKAVEGQDDEECNAEREEAQSQVDTAEKAIKALYTLFKDVEKNWATTDSRVLGHVVYSPPILLGAGTPDEQYTEDYAIIKVDDDKIDRTKFNGNAIYLGDEIPSWEFTKKMHPSPKSAPFKFPSDRLLKLRGTISDSEMRHPTTLDENGDPCIVVIKRGSTTGTTIGRASGIMSFVREYFDNDSYKTSKEWAILPYDNKSGAFSAPGDSGTVVVDGLGRIGGLLTGGSGVTASTDITYVTPIDFLLKSIKTRYPNVHL